MAVLSSTMASSAMATCSKKRKRSSSTLSSGVLLSSFLLSLLLLLTVASASQDSVVSPFWMIVDGGSTGSRVHLFEFVPKTEHAESDDDDEYTLERRGSARADEPLSAYGRTTAKQWEQPLDPATVAAHLLPALQEMQELVPVQYRKHTRVRYLATAGMRLLPESEQEAVYDALYTGLQQAPALQLQVVRQDILTLSGELEGYYGAVAANFLHGTVNTQLEWTQTEAALRQPIGALDMGGSSTQIVFLPQPQQETVAACLESLHLDDRNNDEESLQWQQRQQQEQSTTCHTAAESELPSRLNGHDFFATSYLSYGVDQFRARFYETLVREHVLQHGHDEESQVCDACRIDNPCAFRGHEMEWASNNQVAYTLVGTGQAEECAKQVSRLIPHPTAVVNHHSDEDDIESQDNVKLGSHVGGVEHPPVRGKFFAMSLYFFTLDSLRELSHAHHVNDDADEHSHSSKQAHEALNRAWPTPSIRELTQALPGLCSRSWHDDLALIADTAHTFTRPAVLPHRCFEAVYMVTLLREGFGFEDDSRDITFLFLVDGSEVEWTLGMALALFAEQLQEQSASAAQNQDSTNATDQDAEPPSDAPSERRLWDRLAKQILLSSW